MASIEFLDLSGLKENTADSILTYGFSGLGGLVSATPGTLTYLTGTPDDYYYYYSSNDIEDYYTITLDGAFAFVE